MAITDIVRYFGALFLVLALVGVSGIFIRRFGLPGVVGGRGRRLSVVESVMLGNKHRLFLVRCDAVEHILVTSPQGTTLIDSAGMAAPPSFEKILSTPHAGESLADESKIA